VPPTPVQSKSLRMEKRGAEPLHRTERTGFISVLLTFLQR
jgi:hypothetical protein